MLPRPAISVLFVCAGNHCCSPAALGIAKALVADRDLRWLHVDAAGTTPDRRGEPPHPLTIAEGARRGYRIDHRSRPVHPDDFAEFDLIIAMHQTDIDDLRRLGGSTDQRIGPYGVLEPQQAQLLRRWDPYGMPGDEDLSDPCGRGSAAYAAMFDVLERSIPPLLDHLAWLTEDIIRETP
jgi:protein-tyrosine-phosphatase